MAKDKKILKGCPLDKKCSDCEYEARCQEIAVQKENTILHKISKILTMPLSSS